MDEELNGLNLSELKGAIEAIKIDPEKARSHKWTSRVLWQGGFKAKAFTKHHSFIVDEPAKFASKGEGPTAVEYVLGALGACLTAGFVLNATKKGIEIYNMEVALEGEIDNILTFLGLSEEGHPGYREISAKLYVSADADRETLEEIWEETLETSPVGNSLSRIVTIKPALSII